MRRYDLDRATLGWLALLALFFATFLVYPVGLVLAGAFRSPDGVTFRHFAPLLTSPVLREAWSNSLQIGLLATAICSLIALPLAQLFARVEFKGKVLLNGLLLLPLVMPPFVGAIGLRQLFGRFGSVNLGLMALGIIPPDGPVDWLGTAGVWGVALLQALSLYPILLLNLTAAMANLDPALRDAAQSSGASGFRVFRTITLPLILPSYASSAAVVFIWAFTDLGTPLVFGLTRVVPVQVFDSLTELNTNPQGYALVVLVLLFTSLLYLVTRYRFGRGRFEMLSRSATGTAIGQANARQTGLCWVTGGLVVGVALLPHVAVVTQAVAGRWSMTVLPEVWSGAHFAELFRQGGIANSIRNSLLYSSWSAFLDLGLGVLIAWLLTRRRVPLGWLLDVLAMLPLAIPGIVIAFGYVAAFDWRIAWLNPRENPTLLLIISYSVRRLPYMVRAAHAGFQQASLTLEEASLGLGASSAATLRRITLPLVAANLVAGTILAFAFAMIEVSDSLILAMRESSFPITKMIYQLLGRIEPDAANVACALGVLGMSILALSLLLAGRLAGKRLGQLFRA